MKENFKRRKRMTTAIRREVYKHKNRRMDRQTYKESHRVAAYWSAESTLKNFVVNIKKHSKTSYKK